MQGVIEKELTWTVLSNKHNVVSVNSEAINAARITAKNPGTATVTARSVGNYTESASCEVTVVKPVKIYLSPSDQIGNAWGNYPYNESQKMVELSKKIRTLLQNYGYEVFGCRVDHEAELYKGRNDKVAARIKESDNLEVDLHIALHSNAVMPNQTLFGPETYFFVDNLDAYLANPKTTPRSERSKKSEKLAGELQEKLFSLYASPQHFNLPESANRGLKVDPEWRELTQTRVNTIPAYIEVAYHNHKPDEKWIDENLDKIAEVIAEGIRNFITAN